MEMMTVTTSQGKEQRRIDRKDRVDVKFGPSGSNRTFTRVRSIPVLFPGEFFCETTEGEIVIHKT